MTNNNININTDTLRQALNGVEEALKEVRTLLPTTRTLADMTAEEREACQWMQAEVAGGPFARGVIVDINESCEWVHVVSNSGESHRGSLGFITPLPDLPRMEWPGNEPEEAHVDSPEPAVPRPEDVPVGEPWQVEIEGRAAIGYRNDPESRLCWAVVSRDDGTGHHWMYDSDVTLIARLVPETTEQDAVTEFDPAYTYRDKDGDK